MQATARIGSLILLFTAVAVADVAAQATERFVYVPFEGLEFDGERPATPGSIDWRQSWLQDVRAPYVVLDVPGEAYLDYVEAPISSGTREWVNGVPALAVRLTSDAPVTGRIWMPTRDWQGLAMHRFRVAKPDASLDPRARFFEAMEEHYARLDRRDLPGDAWFRHRAAWARKQRGGPVEEPPQDFSAPVRGLDDTLELFSGARAIAENLDLDRGLRAFENEPLDVPIDSLEGVTTRALDWKALVAGLEPELDPLAKSIPFDQHAVFFPSFAALTDVIDELDRSGTPLLEFFASDVQDARTKDRYQEQLCLPLSAVARLLGPSVVSSVALTGGDPFVRAGTDVTLLFECKQPAVLEGYLASRQAEAEKRGAWKDEGDLGGVRYKGVHTADRRISSYVTRFGDVLAVSNSVVSLRRVADAIAGRAPSLASTDEYVWFRNRYERGEPGESALIVLSDATIRRWAGPRARIGDSRRVRAAAAMAEIQCRHLPDLVAGRIGDGASAADATFAVSADFLWSKDGVRSPAWGTISFLTPLAELELDKISASEKRAYESFRESFQRRWSTVFDPIAVRLSFDAGKLAADVTIMPLTASTDYREFREFAGGAKLGPHAGDPHPESLLHFATAFDAKSEFGNMLSGAFGSQLGADPLAWLGDGISLYVDGDPYWDELKQKPDVERALSETFYRLPVALHCEVKDPLKLAAFMTGLRTIANQAAPDLTTWQTREFEGHTYVRVAVDEDVDWGEAAAEAAVYYSTLPKALIVSLREDVLQRALKRYDARKSGADEPAQEWLGKSMGLRVERDVLDILTVLGGESLKHEVVRAAWTPIPILDEWKRLFPDQDALALHERFFGVRLVSPSGGTFTWDETSQTFASTEYGSPASPKEGPGLPRAVEGFVRGEFGLEFEGEGLRARAELSRKR